jgi:hypothetical protein
MPSCWAIVVTESPLGVQGMDGLVGCDPGGVALLLCGLPPLLLDGHAPVPPAIQQSDGPRAGHERQRLRGAGRCRLQRGLLVMQEGLDGLPQVF